MHGYGCMGIKIDLHIDSAGKEKQVKVREAVIIYSAASRLTLGDFCPGINILPGHMTPCDRTSANIIKI